MEHELEAVWKIAKIRYENGLTPKHRAKLLGITSQEALLADLRVLRNNYTGVPEDTPSMWRRLDRFVAQMRDFTHIINIYVQSNPGIASLVWGSVALVLEVSCNRSVFESSWP